MPQLSPYGRGMLERLLVQYRTVHPGICLSCWHDRLKRYRKPDIRRVIDTSKYDANSFAAQCNVVGTTNCQWRTNDAHGCHALVMWNSVRIFFVFSYGAVRCSANFGLWFSDIRRGPYGFPVREIRRCGRARYIYSAPHSK